MFLCVWPELLARKFLPEVKMRKAGMNDGSYCRRGDRLPGCWGVALPPRRTFPPAPSSTQALLHCWSSGRADGVAGEAQGQLT